MLNQYRSDVYSQNGEDGVLKEILERLGIPGQEEGWCVEFGAWDGVHLSNTFRLVEQESWNAIYIEGDPEKYQALCATATSFPAIEPKNSWVGDLPPAKSLDAILRGSALPLEYHVLSIDIDSYDLAVWAQHRDYSPAIVIIEIESSIPPGIEQWHTEELPGNSFTSTLKVARAKGYELVCHTGNMFFVRNDLVQLIGLDEIDLLYPERLFLSDWLIGTRKGRLHSRFNRYFTRLPPSLKGRLKAIVP